MGGESSTTMYNIVSNIIKHASIKVPYVPYPDVTRECYSHVIINNYVGQIFTTLERILQSIVAQLLLVHGMQLLIYYLFAALM